MDDNDQLDNLSVISPSIEIITESEASVRRDMGGSTFSVGGWSVIGEDEDLTDCQKLSKHSKMARLVHHDGRQFIERRDLDDGGLPYSAELYLNDEVWKLNGEDCLLMSHRRYIAKVSVESSIDLEETTNFEEAARILLKHVNVVKVLLDEQVEECLRAKDVLQMVLEKVVGDPENQNHKCDIMALRILLKKYCNPMHNSFMDDLENFSNLSHETTAALKSFVKNASKLIRRDEILGRLNNSTISDDFINDAVHEALTNHRARVAAICPSILMDVFEKEPDDNILYISMDDINLFADMSELDQVLLQSVLPMLFSKLLKKTQEMNDKQLVDLTPLSSQILLFVCKSLLEIAEQYEAQTENDCVIIYDEKHGWQLSEGLEELQTPNDRHLRQQLQMIAALANHFEPGGPFRTVRFPYEFKLFQNLDAIPEPVRIWLCLLDDCMKGLLHTDSDKTEMFSCFFRSFVTFMVTEEFDGETLEGLRMVTHEALRSMADKLALREQDRDSPAQEVVGSKQDLQAVDPIGARLGIREASVSLLKSWKSSVIMLFKRRIEQAFLYFLFGLFIVIVFHVLVVRDS